MAWEDWWMNEPAPQSRKRTKDSRVTYRDLKGWLECLGQIQERRSSDDTYRVLANHFHGLPLSFIRRCTSLAALEKAAQEIKDFRPPRGQRGGHYTTDLLMEVNNRIAELKRRVNRDES